MKKEHWEIVKAVALGKSTTIHTAFIIDSPWIPGYLGISTLDYLSLPGVWFRANMEVMRQFPEAIFLPGFWVEMGMAAEPSGYGCRFSLFADQPPSIHPLFHDIEEVDRLHAPNPRQDGLMPMVLAQYGNALPMVRAEGMQIKIVAARGPIALAAHLMGVTDFLTAMKIEPEKCHRLLKMTTRTVVEWLEAQADVLPDVEGILVLDDIMGFVGEEDYLEFVHPYLKEVLSLPVTVRLLHNDTPNPVCFKHLEDLGVNIFNFSHQVLISETRELAGKSVSLMGNISPLDIMVNGTAEENYREARRILEDNAGHSRFILSAGGGLSPGTTGANIMAIIRAASDYNS